MRIRFGKAIFIAVLPALFASGGQAFAQMRVMKLGQPVKAAEPSSSSTPLTSTSNSTSIAKIVVPPPSKITVSPATTESEQLARRQAQREAARLAKLEIEKQEQEGTYRPPRCASCSGPKSDPYRDVTRVAGRSEINSSSISFFNRGKTLVNSCRGFINSNGELGEYGQEMADLMTSRRYSSQYLRDGALSDICPKFNKFDDDTRIKAWVWFWMVLANEESTCNVDKYHATHARTRSGRVFRLNPREGWGMFAADLHPGDRNWRGAACQGNIRRFEVQASCAVHTMSVMQLELGTGVLGRGDKRYWGPVRRYGRQIMPNMRGFKACF